jgi:hypothetical protein
VYVLVHHTVSDREKFWATAQEAIPNLPDHLKLHQTFPARDGSRATCVWEADSVAAVQEFLEPALGDYAYNEYAEAENREGIALPTGLIRGPLTA